MAGYGKQGWCKLCAWDRFPELQSRIDAGWKAPALILWAKQFGFEFERKALYRHNEHAKSADEKLVAAAEKTRREIGDKSGRRTRSNKEVLEAIRDIAVENIEADPSQVTVNHALKAIQIMEGTKQGPTNILVLLSQAMAGQLPAQVIEGEATEV